MTEEQVAQLQRIEDKLDALLQALAEEEEEDERTELDAPAHPSRQKPEPQSLG